CHECRTLPARSFAPASTTAVPAVWSRYFGIGLKTKSFSRTYFNEYLRRVAMENRLLRRFDPACLTALLRRCRPGYEELPLNLCEPAFCGALAKSLLGQNPLEPQLSPRSLAELDHLLRGMSPQSLRLALFQAVGEFTRRFSLSQSEESYFSRAAAELCPRIQQALRSGGLDGIFCAAAEE
ncbi:MAG: DUF6179 domain-containing protein, partial [Oscillospiraceae bacterium]|nr:DUF6179 domain-containing protein [Oscillospiraceae bacterium]